MVSMKRYFILQILFLVHLLYMSCALQCKTCEKNNPACLLAEDVDLRDCASNDDVCYSWFDRTKSQIQVQRGCISPAMAEYQLMKDLMGGKDNDCVKRVNGLDCFKFCSHDKCN